MRALTRHEMWLNAIALVGMMGGLVVLIIAPGSLLYFVPAAVALIGLTLLNLSFFRSYRQSRLRTAGRCPACGYDLRATPGRCPECGHVVDS